ncbi:DUF3108 domain-containing protein [Fulvivirgaceae bacterium BMA12]|uniref:DUF3108 domain-containing protein n=1 Tax=Agaribacillus aureus TaxID=3051825 RepID=A0ABT8LCZ0_9BACT|nr:DUF3108 domain-containing protein [Fulvivirgaceae bacterium BMA12]
MRLLLVRSVYLNTMLSCCRIFIFLFFVDIHLARGQCAEVNQAYKAGEIIEYNVAYNWGFIWVNAGEAIFKVEEKKIGGQPVFHFHAYGTSLKKWDWIYRVRDTYESFLDMEYLRPVRFKRNTSEGKYKANNAYEFDYEKGKVYTATQNSDKPLSKDTIRLQRCTFDVLSMIYQARNIDYRQYKKDDKIPISLIIDGEIYNLYIRYLGEELLKTRDKKKYKCIKFKPMLVEGTMFSAGENMTVWVTNDQNRIPLLIEAKVLVGSVKAYLSNTHGLKNTMKSLVK